VEQLSLAEYQECVPTQHRENEDLYEGYKEKYRQPE
jgi:hypothetical protein